MGKNSSTRYYSGLSKPPVCGHSVRPLHAPLFHLDKPPCTKIRNHPFFVHSSFRISSISWNPISFFVRDTSFSNYSFPHQIGPTTFTSVCVCMCVLCSSTISSQWPSSLSVLKMKKSDDEMNTNHWLKYNINNAFRLNG